MTITSGFLNGHPGEKQGAVLRAEDRSLWDRRLYACINKVSLHQRETGYNFGPHSSSTNPGLQSHIHIFAHSKSQKTWQGFFSHTSSLITLLHINTIFICNKIRDYLSIFRCPSSSVPGQCCLYTFGVTSKPSRWLLFHFAQSESSAAATTVQMTGRVSISSCTYQAHKQWVWIYFRLSKQWMWIYSYNKYFALIRLAKETCSLYIPIELPDH